MSIDKAAAAFDADMGNTTSSVDTSSQPAVMEMTDLFPGREIERDVVAGGDEMDPPFKAAETPAEDNKTKRTVEGEPPSEEDLLYGEPPAEGDEEVDPEADEDEEVDPEAVVDEIDIDEFGDRPIRLMIDGEEKILPLKEATQGYIRTATFHQRLNEIDEAKTVLREEASTLLEEKKQVVARLDELIKDSEALLPVEPNWDEAYAKDAGKARALQKQYEEYGRKLNDLRKKRDDAKKDAKTQAEKDTAKYAADERKKFEDANPIWKSDPKKKQIDLASMVRTARALRFTDAEIAQVLDSRLLGALLKASKYDRMMAARPKSVPRGKTPVRPGAGKSRTAPKGIDRSQQQLARTGRVDDAAAVFDNILKTQG